MNYSQKFHCNYSYLITFNYSLHKYSLMYKIYEKTLYGGLSIASYYRLQMCHNILQLFDKSCITIQLSTLNKLVSRQIKVCSNQKVLVRGQTLTQEYIGSNSRNLFLRELRIHRQFTFKILQIIIPHGKRNYKPIIMYPLAKRMNTRIALLV